MKIRNPSGRRIRLEVLAPDGDATVMTMEMDPHTTLDLARYERALDALIGPMDPPPGEVPEP